MDITILNELKAICLPEDIRLNVPLKDYTTMRVGGPAAYLIEAHDEAQIINIIHFASKASIPLLLIGNGSNMIISDRGFDGIVLHINKQMSEIRLEGERIIAQAGAMLPLLSRMAAENSLTGLEFAAGIPGTVGGSVVMNSGAYGGEMKHVVESVCVYMDGKVRMLSADEMEFGYRHSALLNRSCVVLSVTFRLKRGNKEEILSAMADFNARRREKQPLQYPSSGSFFKRPEGHFAGALIQNADLKGYSVGGAQVSELHAGFVINTGKASADDVYRLMLHIQETVYERFSVHLEPEVRLIGHFDV